LTTNANISTKWRRGLYGNGHYVITRDAGGYAVSTDNGITWTFYNMVTGGKVMFGNNIFLIYGSGTAIRRYNSNLTSGQETNPIIGVSGWVGGAYGNGRWVLVRSTGYTISDDDGITWTTTTVDFTGVTSIAFGNGRYVVCLANSSIFYTSTDGTNWTSVSVTSSNYTKIIYANSFFVAVSTNAVTTLDGTNPSTVTHHSITTNFTSFYLDIVAGNNLFVLVGGNTSSSPFASTIVFTINPFEIQLNQSESFSFPLELVLYDPVAEQFVSFIDNASRTAAVRLTAPIPE
jgi:hypothetical protein